MGNSGAFVRDRAISGSRKSAVCSHNRLRRQCSLIANRVS